MKSKLDRKLMIAYLSNQEDLLMSTCVMEMQKENMNRLKVKECLEGANWAAYFKQGLQDKNIN